MLDARLFVVVLSILAAAPAFAQGEAKLDYTVPDHAPRGDKEFKDLQNKYEAWRQMAMGRDRPELKDKAWRALQASAVLLDWYQAGHGVTTLEHRQDLQAVFKWNKELYTGGSLDGRPKPMFLGGPAPSGTTTGSIVVTPESVTTFAEQAAQDIYAPTGGGGKSRKAKDLRPVDRTAQGDPTDDDAGTSRGGAFTQLMRDDPRRAAELLDRYAADNPKDANALALRAALRRMNGDATGAEADAKAALALDPANKLARAEYAYRAETADAAGRAAGIMSGGFAPMRETGRGEAGDGGVAVGRGVARTPAEQKAALDALAVAAAGIGPGVTPKDQAQALIQSAVGKLALGDANGALFDLSRALMLDKDSVRARVLRAHISNLWRNKNWAAAIQDADAALALDPRSAAAMFEKGYALLQLGDTAGAMRNIEQGLTIEPDNAMGRYYHAMVLDKVGLVARAVAEYKEAMRLDPALAPLVEEALAKMRGETPTAAGAEPTPRRARTMRTIVLAVLGLTAFGLLLEGGKRVFAKDWKTSVSPATRARAALSDAPTPSAPGTLTQGFLLEGNFRVEKELARGGLGIVYQATDVRLKRSVAIKRLNREAYESPEIRERFFKEAQLAARLRHPNLAEIFSIVGRDELYLVFELVEGETVHDRLVKKGKLSLRETADILKDAAAAIDYAHTQKVIHRDLKPANLMIRPDGKVKVLDFGIAHETRAMSGATQTQAWGTPPYMAPEQEMGSVCRESDVYALGVVAYELLTGTRPFSGSYLLTMKINKQYRPVSDLVPGSAPELKAFFARALAPDPADRFKTAGELARALAAIETTPMRASAA